MNTKMLCLGVLSLGKASGYDIGKQLEQIFGNFIDVAASGVYPALKTLYEEGLVDYEKVEQNGLPNKKLYELTEQGRETFLQALSELPPRHKIRSQFILLLFFSDMLSEERLQEVIAERVGELKLWIDLTREWTSSDSCLEASPGQQFIARYALEVMRTEIDFLESNADSLLETLGSRDTSGMNTSGEVA